jgi:hypothetical protein
MGPPLPQQVQLINYLSRMVSGSRGKRVSDLVQGAPGGHPMSGAAR